MAWRTGGRPGATRFGWWATALLGLGIGPAQADPVALHRVEILGSHLKRAGTDQVFALEVHTRKDIERTGATSLNEWMRSVTSFDISDLGELDGGWPGVSGTANARLRGLDGAAVLVLLNGRRLPLHPMHDVSGQGAAVDLNMVPLSLIERVEILKDGASALYGADAVAGVINLVTRRDLRGLEVQLSGGVSRRGDSLERGASLQWGRGSLDEEGSQWLAAIDLFRRQPVLRSRRELSRSADFRRFGGPDARSSFSPFGNLVDANYLPTGATVRPCPAELLNDGCRYDFNGDTLTGYNGADRVGASLMVRGTGPERVLWSSDLLVHDAVDRFEAHPIPDIFQTLDGNPYLGRFLQGGPRTAERRGRLVQWGGSIEGQAEDLDWQLQAGLGRSRLQQTERNYFDQAGWLQAVSDGTLDPTSTANDPALVDRLRIRPQRLAVSTVSSVDGLVRRRVGTLPGGPVELAVGVSARRESLSDAPDAQLQQGLVYGNIQQSAVEASRSAAALSGEMSLPLDARWSSQLALRHDHYAQASRTSPKVGLTWRPSPSWTGRGSYAGSFRMPTLKQLYGARDQGASDFSSEALCATLSLASGCAVPGFEVYGANPALRPERGRTVGAGIVFAPVSDWQLGLDWWRVSLRDAIATPSIDQAVAAGRWHRDDQGRLQVETTLVNLARQESEGVDADWQGRWVIEDVGVLTLRGALTRYFHQRRQADPGADWTELNGSYARPRWRHVLSAELSRAAWSWRLALRSTGGFRDSDQAPQPGDRWVASHSELDAAVHYAPLGGLQWELAIKNLFDRMPPFSAQNAASNQYSQLGYAELYTARGRFVQLGVRYRWR